jgi:hypothetical protein
MHSIQTISFHVSGEEILRQQSIPELEIRLRGSPIWSRDR